ncbi:MAG TPA: class I SAM-dependent methyltransferase [Nitrosomonas halophila]|nr:class I SAM-dependent methyltransferase [Nitrosomonas halophila]
MRCPVCNNEGCRVFLSVGHHDYWRCETCLATFLDPSQRPSGQSELALYRLHRNDPMDAAYRAFLNRAAGPLLERLPPARQGLDFGCRLGPALAIMLREAGHTVALFDPFFYPDPAVLASTYDFITCTEVAEHFHRPAEEFSKLDALLNPGGWLALMTTLQHDDAKFANWHYRRDPTHVVFYREATLRYLAAEHGWQCEFPFPNVALMHKPVTGSS